MGFGSYKCSVLRDNEQECGCGSGKVWEDLEKSTSESLKCHELTLADSLVQFGGMLWFEVGLCRPNCPHTCQVL